MKAIQRQPFHSLMPRLKVTHPGQERTEYEFGEHPVTIGRGGQNLVVIDDERVSRQHAVLECLEGSWWLRDLGSVNGTFHDGVRIERLCLSDPAHFELGGCKFRFALDGTVAAGMEAEAEHLPGADEAAPGAPPAAGSPATEAGPNKKSKTNQRVEPNQKLDHEPAAGRGKGRSVSPARVPPPAGGVEKSVPVVEPATLAVPSAQRFPWLKVAALLAVLATVAGIAGWAMRKKGPDSPEDKGISATPPAGVPASGQPNQQQDKVAAPPDAPAARPAVEPAGGAAPPPADARTVLLSPLENELGFQPVFSPGFDQVLHLKKAASGSPGGPWLDVFLNEKPVLRQVKISSESQLRFSPDGARWAVQATDSEGRCLIALADRRIQVPGELHLWTGNQDFSAIATVSREGDEDHLHINGERKSSYHHIREPQVSRDGRRWAYVAVRSPGSQLTPEPAGERVVTQEGSFEVCDQVLHLQMAADGSRVVWLGVHHGGRRTLMSDHKLVHELPVGAREEVRSITLSNDGARLAWAVVPELGDPVFHLEDSKTLSLPVSASADSAEPVSLLRRKSPVTRILFSEDGRRAVFAAAGETALLMDENGRKSPHSGVLLETLSLAPDGEALAYVTLQPLGPANAGGAQPHEAVLWVNDEKMAAVPDVTVRRVGRDTTAITGGISGARFSPDGSQISYLVFVTPSDAGKTCKQAFINRSPVTSPQYDILGASWRDTETLVIIGITPDGQTAERSFHRASKND